MLHLHDIKLLGDDYIPPINPISADHHMLQNSISEKAATCNDLKKPPIMVWYIDFSKPNR